MHISLKSIFAGIVLCIGAAAAAQNTLPTTVINGKEYYYYDVKPKETLFSVARTLNMSREAILEANPAARDGLQAYTRLYFPVEMGQVEASERHYGEPVSHTVRRGETLYGISKQYGVTVDNIIALNPGSRDGVKAGDVLVIAAPAEESATPAAVPSGAVHVIAQGETLYRIAADNGVTVEQLLSCNPDVDPFNYSAGTTLNIPAASAAASAPRTSVPAVTTSSSRTQHGEEMANLADHASEPRTVPVAPAQPAAPAEPEPAPEVADEPEAPVQPEPAPATVPAPAPAEEPAPAPAPAPAETHTAPAPAPAQADSEPLRIAVILPFMLNEETPSRATGLYTDFYRGFLMAADTLSHSGRPVQITAYDSANSADTVASIMLRPEIADMNLIITPDNETQFERIAEKANPDKTFLLNLFMPRNDAYKTNANVIQANIPSAEMYEKAIAAFLENRDGRTPVFISRVNGQADKATFVGKLKERLDSRSIPYRELTFHNVLTDTDLEALSPDSSYVFVPISGTRTEFIKIAPALRQYSAVFGGTDGATLFGYPEWLTFRGDLLSTLQEMNAVIYTRFYNDEDYNPYITLAGNFRRWYGTDMQASVPSQAVLGFDTGNYVIKALRANGGDFHINPYPYEGLQSSFILNDTDCDGLVNTSLLLVRFHRNGLTDHQKL